MKILYLTLINVEDPACIGIFNKINGQLNALKNFNHDIWLSFFCQNGYVFIDGTTKMVTDTGVRVKNHRVGRYLINGDILRFCAEKKIDILYIRFLSADWIFLSLLKHAKTSSVKKIIVEIPTFPYDNQYKNSVSILRKIKHVIDLMCRNRMGKWVDLISTSGLRKSIFGIPTVFIDNAVDVEKTAMAKVTSVEGNVTLLGVANLSTWHGYDRLIQGLSEYYRSEKAKEFIVKFDIVGDGDEKRKLQEQVEKLEMGNYVIFHGSKEGEALDRFFDGADMLVCSLGLHRITNESISPIKSKEYCARGIPFIYSGNLNGIIDQLPFVKKFPDADEAINIYEVIDFFKSYNQNMMQIQTYMRKFAEENFDWKVQMKILDDSINKISGVY